MNAKEMLDGIDAVVNQLQTFRLSGHADRDAVDKGCVVLYELKNLVRDTKADELGDDGDRDTAATDRETVSITADQVGDVAEVPGLDLGQPTDAPTG